MYTLIPRWTYETLCICSFCFQHPVLLSPGQGGICSDSLLVAYDEDLPRGVWMDPNGVLHEIDDVVAAAKSFWVCMIAGLALWLSYPS